MPLYSHTNSLPFQTMIATLGGIRRNTTQENVVSIIIMMVSTVCVNPIAVTFAVIALDNGLVPWYMNTR